jgi:beta-lactamase class A
MINKLHWQILLSCAMTALTTVPAVAVPTIAPVQIPSTQSSSLFANSIPWGKELTPLKAELQSLMKEYSFLSSGVFVMDVETGNYVNLDGDRVFPAASTIKLPILMAFFEAVDAGKIQLDDILTVRRDLIARGSGTLQYSRGKELTALETATKMIVISDNTATNMLIEQLGGKDYLNGRFRAWGLENTYIRTRLGDFKGTNKSTSADLVKVSALIAKHQILSADSRSKALDILNATENRKLLAAGIGTGANIAHKTGDIGFAIGDAGIVERPDGKLYLIGVFVRRPYKDIRGRQFVQKVSRLTYEYLNQPTIIQTQLPRVDRNN